MAMKGGLFALLCWLGLAALTQAQPSGDSLSGMASLQCSGVVVRLAHNQDAPAVLLTNGHCYDKKLKSDAFVADQAHRQSVSLLARGGRSRQFNIARILYATMTGTDLALMELSATYRELADAGIDSYDISPQPAAANEAVVMVSGYLASAQNCVVEKVVPRILEAPWEWRDSYKLKGCNGDRNGTSGSPLISAATNRIVGLFNTANDDGMRCTFNNPCEADADGGIVVEKGGAYAQRVDQILTCLDAEGRFDVNVPSCRLFHEGSMSKDERASRCGNLIAVGDPCAGGISEKTFDSILDRIEDVYIPIVKKSYGARLKVGHLWKHPAVEVSSRGGDPRSWNLTAYGGMARYPGMTAEAFALAACHELGHLIGGYPRDYDATSEGGSDYFAALKCMRRVLSGDRPMSGEVDPVVRQACAGVYPAGADRNICEISSMAGMTLAVFVQETSDFPQPRPSFSTPDPSITSQPYRTPPTAQCRLDIIFQAALCAKPVDENVSDADPAPGACTAEQGFTTGLRPLCWYKPPQRKAPQVHFESLPGTLSGRGL